MHYNKQPLRIISFFAFLGLIVQTAYSQDATTPVKQVTSSNNQLAYLMVAIALVLAFVIWGMGQVLVTIAKQALDKSKKQRTLSIVTTGLLLLSGLVGNAQDATVPEVVKTIPNYGGLSSTAFWMLATVILFEVVTIIFMLFSIRRIQAELVPQVEKEGSTALQAWWTKIDQKFFTRAVAVEKEADIMLDHDYDGIRELDNALPPWWKYGFYVTIVVAIIYLLNFHVLGYGKNPIEEYETELVEAQFKKDAYESKAVDKIDESNLKMPDAANLEAGKTIYNSVCWTCHGKLGEGGAGPNLTDNYWIHKGSLSDVYKSIKLGYPDKGMQAWEKNYSPKEINNLAGYIMTLKGTNPPNGKAAQGDLFQEIAVTTTDSLATPMVTDSVATEKK